MATLSEHAVLNKIVVRGKIYTRNTQILHDRSHTWHSTGTSRKSGGVELVLWPSQISCGF